MLGGTSVEMGLEVPAGDILDAWGRHFGDGNGRFPHMSVDQAAPAIIYGSDMAGDALLDASWHPSGDRRGSACRRHSGCLGAPACGRTW